MAHAPTHYAHLVQVTIERVLARPSVAVSVADLALPHGLTPLQLAWLFHGMVGEPLEAFISRICLERAVLRLVTTDQPLEAVAQDVGYPSLADFEAAFKAAFTTSPRLFRRLRTPRFELPAACGIHYSEGTEPPLFLPVDTNGRFLPVRARDLPPLRLALSAMSAMPAVPAVSTGSTTSSAMSMASTALPLRSVVAEQLQRLRAELADSLPMSAPAAAAPASVDDVPTAFVVPHLEASGAVTLTVAITVHHDVVLPPGFQELTMPAGFVVCCRVVNGESPEQMWQRFLGEWLPNSAERLRPVPLLEALIAEPLAAPATGQQLRTELYLPVA